MFVRRVLTRSKGAGQGVSYRLVHAVRIGPGKVRQVVLAYFRAGLEQRVPKPHWKRLAAAIRDRLAGQPRLQGQAAPPPADQALAERIDAEAEAVAPLVRRRLRDADFDLGFHVTDDARPAGPRETPLSVLPSTLRHTDVREVGAARLLRAAPAWDWSRSSLAPCIPPPSGRPCAGCGRTRPWTSCSACRRASWPRTRSTRPPTRSGSAGRPSRARCSPASGSCSASLRASSSTT